MVKTGYDKSTVVNNTIQLSVFKIAVCLIVKY